MFPFAAPLLHLVQGRTLNLERGHWRLQPFGHLLEEIPQQGLALTGAQGGLGLMDRQRVKMWLRDIYTELDSVGI